MKKLQYVLVALLALSPLLGSSKKLSSKRRDKYDVVKGIIIGVNAVVVATVYAVYKMELALMNSKEGYRGNLIREEWERGANSSFIIWLGSRISFILWLSYGVFAVYFILRMLCSIIYVFGYLKFINPK